MRGLSDRQRRAMFARQASPSQANRAGRRTALAIGLTAGALVGANLGRVVFQEGIGRRALIRGITRAGFGAAERNAATSTVTALQVIRSAQRLDPRLRRTLRIVRSMPQPGRHWQSALSSFAPTNAIRVLGRRRIGGLGGLRASMAGSFEAKVLAHKRSRRLKLLLVQGREEMGRRPYSPVGLAHELGHLSAQGRTLVARLGSTNATKAGTVTFARLIEEARASVLGARAYKRAGGRYRDAARELLPAWASYLENHPPAYMAAGAAVTAPAMASLSLAGALQRERREARR